MTDETGERLDEAAAIVSGWPVTAQRLRAAHVPRPDGRCAVCGGNGRPAPHWPCRIADLVLASGTG